MIIKENVVLTPFHRERTLHIYLPDNWKSKKKKYPVLYMLDGHNLFYDEDATYGTCWGIRNYLDLRKAEIIIVGIECSHIGNERIEEFSPYDFSNDYLGEIHGRGKQFMDWLTSELIPYISSRYPVKTGRKHTGIAGSSMGGLMSLYGIFVYNEFFAKAACLSSFLKDVSAPLFKELNACTLHKDTRIYLSWGAQEFRGRASLACGVHEHLHCLNLINRKKADFYVYQDLKGKHNEASWEKQNSLYFSYLFPECFPNKK